MSQLEWVTTEDHPRFSSSTDRTSHALTRIEADDHLRPPCQHITHTEADR